MVILCKDEEYTIARTGHGYVVINENGTYNNHSHFNSLGVAKKCVYLVKHVIIPRHSRYMLIACKRLTINEDYIAKLIYQLDNKNPNNRVTKRRLGRK